MELIRIPKKFYDDHTVNLSLEAPPVVKETRQHYFIDASSEHLAELLSNASFYADPFNYSHAEFGSWLAALVKSARATEAAIEKHLKQAA